jgi:hypothetical protein
MSTTTTTVQYEARPASEAIELRHLGSGASSSRQTGPETKEAPHVEEAGPHVSNGDDGGGPPMNAHTEAERWNRPVKNVGRLAFAFISFAIAGMNDAAVGVS